MMAKGNKESARERKMTKMTIVGITVMILMSILILVTLVFSKQFPVLKGVGIVLIGVYVVGYAVFLKRWIDGLDEMVQKRNADACVFAFCGSILAGGAIPFLEINKMLTFTLSWSHFMFLTITLYYAAYAYLWWRSREEQKNEE
jgi:Ca2+/Na+ antiporter